MLRRPAFWLAFVVLSIVAAVFTFKNFSTAFPLVSVDLKMDRPDALREARALAEKNAWPPSGYDQAAEFGGNQEVQNFIELEGGGKAELGRVIKEKIFAPYTWRVRLFKEGDAHETLVRFTPEGEPYGFRVKLPDQEKGESKTAEEAQRVAEDSAANTWKVDFSRYQRVESSKDVKPGGRADHTFVYERQDERLREGRYRLRLVVGGDKLSELTYFVQIPEAFTRRYEQLRSANDAINAASSIAVFGPYLLGICGLGLFFMIRQRWLLWRQATFWGVFIALLMGLAQLNQWPLLWMNYDTAVPASGFAIRQVMGAIGIFGAFAVLLTISFMAAETLSRRAFPEHVQFWKVWSKPVASSPAMLGQTLGGYLLVAPFFAYEIILYFFTQGKLGWWTPSDTLINPDMFANYVPSLSAVAQAAQAGFWEECLFRAAPLATAALIGDKFGKRRAFIFVGMILQAIVFASGHAGYANQPAYARVVELIIPSFAFGTMYLAFGLLPGIILHFVYDAAWMALPLFVSSGVRAHVEQAIVIVAVFIPLGIVLLQRARSPKWSEVPQDDMNEAWKPRELAEAQPAEPAPVPVATSISAGVWKAVPILGILGLVAWIFASPFRTDAPGVQISRAEAEQKARMEVPQASQPWTVLGRVEGQPGEVNRFVWQKAGKDRYKKLLGVYVTPASWVIRSAHFKGDVAERAEEYQVWLDGGGRVFRVNHQLPEARPGKSLTESEARVIAQAALKEPLANFTEVSAEAKKRPARGDWTFVFKDTRDYGLSEGEPRVSIEIAGDQVVDTARYVYVPEEWSRNERARQNIPTILSVVCTILVVALAVGGAVIGVIHWSRKRPFSARAFFAVLATMFVLNLASTLNNWPTLAAGAVTTQPLGLQLGIIIAVGIVSSLFIAVTLGLVAGLVSTKRGASAALQPRRSILLGASVGLAMAGAGALAALAAPSVSPLWGNLGPASSFIPFFGAALAPIGGYITRTLILCTALYLINHKPQLSWLWILVGLALAGSGSIETIPSWLIAGTATGIVLWLVYRFVFRHQPELLLITTATMTILAASRDGIQHMYAAALPGALAAVALVAVTCWIWFRGTMEGAERRQSVATAEGRG